MRYPHNSFVPLPYPLLIVSQIRSTSLADLTLLLTESRVSFSRSPRHLAQAYTQILHPSSFFPGHPEAEDEIAVSNVSASRILESDWTPAGAKRTVCGYRYQLVPTEILFTNAVYFAGRLDDGSVVLDTTVNKHRLGLLEEEIKRLVAEAAKVASMSS